MPVPSVHPVKKVMDGVDRIAKGPLDRIADLKNEEAKLKKRIAAGESGDGLKKPDLVTTLKEVQGQRRMLEDYQKNPKPPLHGEGE